MPRVATRTKAKRGRKYICGKCDKPIKPGTKFYTWSFRYGGTRYQHEACGYPRRGQLTQSKLGSVYDAVDDAETIISKATSPEDIGAALSGVKDTVDDVQGEYEEAAEAMGAAGESGTSREYADELSTFGEELDSAASDIEGEEFEEEDGETEAEWLEGLREKATDALGTLEL